MAFNPSALWTQVLVGLSSKLIINAVFVIVGGQDEAHTDPVPIN